MDFFSDLWGFLMERKAWWLLPIIVMLLLITIIVILAEAVPGGAFVYTLF